MKSLNGCFALQHFWFNSGGASAGPGRVVQQPDRNLQRWVLSPFILTTLTFNDCTFSSMEYLVFGINECIYFDAIKRGTGHRQNMLSLTAVSIVEPAGRRKKRVFRGQMEDVADDHEDLSHFLFESWLALQEKLKACHTSDQKNRSRLI